MIGAIAAVALGGMFFLIPSEPQEKAAELEASPEPPEVIGRSVAPEVIEDPNNPVLGATAAEEERAPAPVDEEPAASPDRPDRSGNFADSFKAAAR
jgi:hypothetical protein